ncbi:hypothetical protein [Streptomyces sp. MMBL 11-3]|uniref:hypothetical protein n=1 Tax=Streptomyces sp. MMBL 11-3 TaxID=3382639 RepID=UPI0039B416DD
MSDHRVLEAKIGTAGVQGTAELLPDADRHADWSAVRALWQQMGHMLDSGVGRVPAELTEGFVDEIAKVHANYAGREVLFCRHVLAVLADVEGEEILDVDTFRRRYEDDRFTAPAISSATSQRLPTHYETIVESCRRLRDARLLRAACHDTRSTGLLVGSACYGRFRNVRGSRLGTAASDLDLVVITEGSDALEELVAASAVLPGVSAADIERFRRRADVFADGLDDGRTVFSHKLGLWGDGTPDPLLPSGVARPGYLLSLHLMTRRVLEYTLVASAPRLIKESAGGRRTLRDYRETAAGRWDDLYDFAGRRHRMPLEGDQVDHGFLRTPRIYYIDEADCYFPGFYQTMMFPEPDLVWDGLDVLPALKAFRGKLHQRVRHESNQRVHTLLRPSFAHVRRDVFLPGIIRLLDAG